MSAEKQNLTIAIAGAGTMGRGIAQIAAMHGHPVRLIDSAPPALDNARSSLENIFARLQEKGKMSGAERQAALERISFSDTLDAAADAGLVIEAVLENLEIKQTLFRRLEAVCLAEAVLATNTSSLPVTAIAAACGDPTRVLGVHFFNPAPLLPLVEIIPGVASAPQVVMQTRRWIDSWGKTTVLARDTPGFIVNRVARPFYGEALRIYEEGLASPQTIDWAMRELGGFRMGPFELMDLIGIDINFTVTETVFAAFYYDPRFKPSFTQKRMVEAGYLGRKSGRGFYDYRDNAVNPAADTDVEKGRRILQRIRALLINEAADAVFMQVATVADVDLAMTRGVNYPRGLLNWADELGLAAVLQQVQELYDEYGEDRYRPNPLLRRLAREGRTFAQYAEQTNG